MVFQGGFKMSDERDKLSESDELESDENDVEAHQLGGGYSVLGDDEKGVLGEDGERSRLL
jgi:hypothetical protein